MTDADDELRRKRALFSGFDGSRSGHNTEIIPRAGGLYEPHCKTCGWRPPEFSHSEHDADLEARGHHYAVATGKNQVAARGVGMGPTIRHARDMADRETTPENERREWLKLADEMESRLKSATRTKPGAILDGQEPLFTDDEGA